MEKIMAEFDENGIRKMIIPLLEKAGQIVETKAKELCPVDTGRLRASIQHKVDEAGLSVEIGTNVPYAKHVEYMHPLDSPRPGRETGQMPFLRPALFKSKREIEDLLK